MRMLKQSTAANVMVFMTSSSDHVSGATGLTLTITASKDGGAFASISPSATERGNGWYSLALTASHLDTLGDFALHITASGADPTDTLSRVVGGSLDADISSRLSSAGYTAPDNATVSAIYGVVDTEIGAIKAKTDNLPADPASNAEVNAVAGETVTALQATAIPVNVKQVNDVAITGSGIEDTDEWRPA